MHFLSEEHEAWFLLLEQNGNPGSVDHPGQLYCGENRALHHFTGLLLSKHLAVSSLPAAATAIIRTTVTTASAK